MLRRRRTTQTMSSTRPIRSTRAWSPRSPEVPADAAAKRRTFSRNVSLRRLRSCLDVGIVQMLGLPAHRFPDACATRRMVVEDGFLPRPRIEFAVGAELEHDCRKCIGFAHGVQPEHISLDFCAARDPVAGWCRDKEK